MRLARFGPKGGEKPGVIDDGGILRDVSEQVDDWSGATLDPDRLRAIARLDLKRSPAISDDVRLGPPVGAVGKIVCVGLNYADHAAEAGLTPPPEPIWFLKATSALSGPDDPVRLPPGAAKLDWEAELAIVIGREASGVDASAALDHVAGYAVFNDVSERAFQLERGTQWTKGKSCDTFGPLGPWLVTPDELQDPGALDIWLDVNGVRQQQSNTAQLIFGVAELVASISGYMSLQPGDVIATGTPAGVGYGKAPQRFLAPGDVVELGIEGLGRQRQVIEGHAIARPA